MQVAFRYGVLCKTLEEQANEQGLTLGNKAEKLEKIKKAVNMCAFHVATDKQIESMEKKLHKKVLEACQPIK